MHDHGETEEGYVFIVMQKYGPSLKEMLRRTKKRERFSVKTGIMIGIQMMERLRDMHSMGLLHLDLKPDNILLGSNAFKSPESSQLVLADFGLS